MNGCWMIDATTEPSLRPVIVPGSLSSATTETLPMSPFVLTATAAAGPSYE